MNLKERMERDEAELYGIISRLNATNGGSDSQPGERERTLYALMMKLVETRCFVDEWLSGCSDRDRNALAYKIRVTYPLYSQLDSLASLSGEFVDWSVRDFSLTMAAAQ